MRCSRRIAPVVTGSAVEATDRRPTSLRHRPADLTQFAARNGGVFNGARIHRFIDGRTVITAHGTMEMPVWGDEFKWREGLPENGITARVDALVRYLETLQERAGH